MMRVYKIYIDLCEKHWIYPFLKRIKTVLVYNVSLI